MSDPTPEEISEIRLKLAKVEFCAKSDEAFLQKLRDDPMGVLQAEGFEDPLARELATQLSGDYGRLSDASEPDTCSACDPWTCIVTGCCAWTFVEPTTSA